VARRGVAGQIGAGQRGVVWSNQAAGSGLRRAMLKPKLIKGSCSIADRAGSLVLFDPEKSGGDGFARPVKLTTALAEAAIAVEPMSKGGRWWHSW